MRNHIGILAREAFPLVLAAAAASWQGLRTMKRRWGAGPAREWPTTSATIDVVSVAEEIREGGYDRVETTGYKATLTYFYRNPDLQMGEYSQTFPLEGAAKRWAEGFKNKSVVVHVNPKDAGDSVLLKDDLEGVGGASRRTLEDELRMEGMPRLKSGYLLLSGISELMALAGLALTCAAVWAQAHHKAKEWMAIWIFVMMLWNAATVWIVGYRADDSHRLQSMLHSCTLFCPAWMRWGVRITGWLVITAYVLFRLGGVLPLQTQHWLAVASSYWFYLFACWAFLSSGATHAAILRSQEMTHQSVVADADGSSAGF